MMNVISFGLKSFVPKNVAAFYSIFSILRTKISGKKIPKRYSVV